MPPTDKGRIAFIAKAATETESRIAAKFREVYKAAGEPKGMALFSHYVEGQMALSITPESVPFAASLFTILEWLEYEAMPPLGAVGWLAGDPNLKFRASTVFSVGEAVKRDEDLLSGKIIGRTHDEVMKTARQALETQPRSG